MTYLPFSSKVNGFPNRQTAHSMLPWVLSPISGVKAAALTLYPIRDVLKDALARSGFRKMHLDPATHSVRFDTAGMQLDVGGIAKGYAADEAIAVLSKLGIQSALVAASGDLSFTDAPPGEKGWKIGIDALDRAILLSNAAVSTSGSTEQNFEVNGVRYSHILNPKTGLGLTTNITTTVIAPHGIDADGMATAINVLGPDRGLAFIENQSGVAAVIATGTKSWSLIRSVHMFTNRNCPSRFD